MTPSVVILAGGPATRLYPLTQAIPKAMLEVAGKPFIAHQLELLKKNNIERVVICLGYLGTQISDFIKEGKDFGLHVDYSLDGEQLLGTGGALKKALNLLDDIFFVMYGDSYLNVEFKIISEYFLSHDKKGLMTILKNNDRWDKSNILYQDGRIIEYNKKNPSKQMQYIDYGLSLLKKDTFACSRYGEIFDLADLYQDLIFECQMLVYEVKERFFEIGTTSGLAETRSYFEKVLLKEKQGGL